MLSNKVCKECHNKLATFYYFKQELVSKQEKLYQLLEERKIEELHEDPSIGFDEVNSEKLEPEIAIKTEAEHETYRTSEAFETIDYDASSGEFRVMTVMDSLIKLKIF